MPPGQWPTEDGRLPAPHNAGERTGFCAGVWLRPEQVVGPP